MVQWLFQFHQLDACPLTRSDLSPGKILWGEAAADKGTATTILSTSSSAPKVRDGHRFSPDQSYWSDCHLRFSTTSTTEGTAQVHKAPCTCTVEAGTEYLISH